MYLITTALAAVTTTVIWYKAKANDTHNLGMLCLMYWGATLMWLVDCIAAVISGEEFDTSLNAVLLGVSVIVLGLIIWFVIKLIKSRTQNITAIQR